MESIVIGLVCGECGPKNVPYVKPTAKTVVTFSLFWPVADGGVVDATEMDCQWQERLNCWGHPLCLESTMTAAGVSQQGKISPHRTLPPSHHNQVGPVTNNYELSLLSDLKTNQVSFHFSTIQPLNEQQWRYHISILYDYWGRRTCPTITISLCSKGIMIWMNNMCNSCHLFTSSSMNEWTLCDANLGPETA